MYRNFCFLFSHSDRLRFLLLMLLMLGGSLIEMGTLGAVPLFVAAILGGDAVHRGPLGELLAHFDGEGGMERLAMLGCALLSGLFLFRTLYLSFSFAFQERILRNRQIALGSRIFRAYMNAPYALLRRRNSSLVIENVSSESKYFIDAVLDPALNFLRNSVLMLGVLCLLLWYDPIVSLASFLTLGVAGALSMLVVNRWMKRLGNEAYEQRVAAVKSVTEGIGVFKEAKVLGCLDYFTGRLHTALQREARPMRFYNTLHKCIWPMMELLSVVVLLGAMSIMIVCGRSIQEVAPTIALLTVSLARLKGCLTELMLYFSTIRYNAAVLDKVSDELRELEGAAEPVPHAQSPSRPHPRPEPRPEPFCLRRALDVRDVSFTYPDGESPVFAGVNISIPAGASVAFVGPTGAGKSTMADLILGLFKPNAGKLLADGLDIAEMLPAWRRSIGFVPQDIFLMDDTIRANIALGVDAMDIDPNALKRAINAAHLKAFVDSLPDGELTVIGERGQRLSGGQRQRIGIARALYRNPSTLLFDEATSALDSGTEDAVVSAIEQLRGTHTIIIVAHRLSTVRSCSALYYFDAGKVEMFGSLHELSVKKPAFTAAADILPDVPNKE